MATVAGTAAETEPATGRASGGRIRVGVGGWTFEPWRDNFFPKGLPHAQELAYASQRLSAIEINGTYYGTQKPESFARWRSETPDGFMFSVKASRYCTNRKVLAEAGESVQRFVHSGLAELGDKLGPVVWQFMPFKRFDADDLAAFLQLLPASVGGMPLRHVLDVRHPSFHDEAYLALVRKHHCATVFADSEEFPQIADDESPFTYARLMKTLPEEPTGYAPPVLDAVADRVREWAEPPGRPPRDVFVYFISGAKERAPAAAMALLERLGSSG